MTKKGTVLSLQAWHIYSKTSAAYFNSRWVSFNVPFLRYHICPHGSWHLVRLGIDHNSVELLDPINLIIVMHILKKCSDKFLKYTFPLEWLHSLLPDISVAFSYVVFRCTDCLKGNVQQQYIYKRNKQHKWYWARAWTWAPTSSFPSSWCRWYGLLLPSCSIDRGRKFAYDYCLLCEQTTSHESQSAIDVFNNG